jgi:hypothetical protein
LFLDDRPPFLSTSQLFLGRHSDFLVGSHVSLRDL